MADAMGTETSAYLHAVIGSSPDGSFGLDFASFQDRLMQDEPETLQRLVYDQLVPQPDGYLLDAPDSDSDSDTIRDLGIPVAYVLAEHDRGLAAPGAELAARVGATPVTVPRHARGAAHPPWRHRQRDSRSTELIADTTPLFLKRTGLIPAPELRATCRADGLHRTTTVSGQQAWLLSQAEDVRTVLCDATLFTAGDSMPVPECADKIDNLLLMDPPRHTVLRPAPEPTGDASSPGLT
jgi:hypothetical protein